MNIVKQTKAHKRLKAQLPSATFHFRSMLPTKPVCLSNNSQSKEWFYQLRHLQFVHIEHNVPIRTQTRHSRTSGQGVSVVFYIVVAH